MAKKKINPCIYNEVVVNDEFTRAIVQNDKLQYGLIELPSFKELAPFKYTTMKKFSCGRSIVSIEGKCGAIDIDGKEVIPPVYEDMTAFYNDVSVVRREGKVGVIDIHGNMIADFVYDKMPYGFHIGFHAQTGTAPMRKKGLYGVIDAKGNEIIPFIYDFCSIEDLNEDRYIQASKGDNVALFDMQGNEIFPLKYRWAVLKNGYIIAGDDRDKCGVIDLQGNVVMPFEYNTYLITCSHGIIAIAMEKGSATTLYNTKGEKIMHLPYNVKLMDYGIYVYVHSQNEHVCGLYDYTGKNLIPVTYEYIQHIGDMRYLVQKTGDKVASVIDLSTGERTPQTYLLQGSLNNGFIVTSEGKFGCINTRLELVVPIIYDKIGWGWKSIEATLDGKSCEYDIEGNIIVSFEQKEKDDKYARGYDYFDVYHGKGYVVGKKNKYGFLDASGNPLGVPVDADAVAQKPKKKKVPAPICPFKEVRDFCEGFAAVMIDDKWGYIDVHGNLIHPITLDRAYDFNDGIARVTSGDGKDLSINTKGEYVPGKIVSNRNSRSYLSVSDGTPGYLYKKEENGKIGWVDHEGKEVIPCVYDGDDRYSKIISLADDINQYVKVRVDGKYGVVNLSGQVILEAEHDSLQNDNGFWISCIDGKEALYTSDGRRLTPHKYERIGWGRDLVEVQYEGKRGVINKEGKEITVPIYDHVVISQKGDYAILTKDNKKGMVRSDGKEIYPVKYDSLSFIDEETGLAPATIGNGSGYIDIEENIVIPFKYRYTYDFVNGFAEVNGHGCNQCGVINPKGEEVMPLQYALVRNYVNEELRLIEVRDDSDKIGIFDLLNAKELLAPRYQDVGKYSDGWLAVKSRGKWGFVDLEGMPLDYPWMKE